MILVYHQILPKISRYFLDQIPNPVYWSIYDKTWDQGYSRIRFSIHDHVYIQAWEQVFDLIGDKR